MGIGYLWRDNKMCEWSKSHVSIDLSFAGSISVLYSFIILEKLFE